MTVPDVTFSMTYTINGEVHSLNGYDAVTGYTFSLIGFEEFGLPPLSRITQRGSFQHGETNIDFRLNPRTMTIRGFVEATSSYQHIKIREMLGRLFKVSNTAATLTLTSSQTLTEPPYTSDIVTRAIDCYVNGGLNVSSDTSSGYDVFFEIELRAATPMWYNPVPLTTSIVPAIVGDPTDVPLLIPRTYGTVAANTSVNVPYDGTFQSYPTITLYGGDGGISNLTLTNTSAGNLKIIITSVPAYATYTIDLRYGYKTVVDQNGTNSTFNINPASNLTTFALFPPLDYGTSTNTITAVGTLSTNAFVDMTYYTQYTSI